MIHFDHEKYTRNGLLVGNQRDIRRQIAPFNRVCGSSASSPPLSLLFMFYLFIPISSRLIVHNLSCHYTVQGYPDSNNVRFFFFMQCPRQYVTPQKVPIPNRRHIHPIKTKMAKSIPYFKLEMLENDTLWGGTYLHGLYMGISLLVQYLWKSYENHRHFHWVFIGFPFENPMNLWKFARVS